MNEREVFLSALEIEEPDARRAHLQSVCADDADLLARVEALLASHECQSRFLNTPVMAQLVSDELAHPVDQTPPTLLVGEGTRVDPQLSAGARTYSDLATRVDDGANEDDEIPLGYLTSSTNPKSLGRLGHYEILEVVGRGAFGTVLRAYDEKLQRVVAIKVLAPEIAATSPARKRFLREARTSAAIRHEDVVAIYAVEDGPIPYLVMEFIPGQTLQQRLDEHGPLDLPDVLRLGKQIADGLAAAHAQGLIHRDIKPGNILLEGGVTERVKITDFGLARTTDDASMTQSGMIAGTPLYMAPEQARGERLDQRADLFSFGSVLYQMLSGRPPFRAANTVAVLKRVVEDTPRPIREIIPEVPPWMCELIGHLHAKNPDDRYSTAQRVSELLARCLEDLQAGRTPQIPSPHSSATPQDANAARGPLRVAPVPARAVRLSRKRFWPTVAAAGLLLLIGLGVTESSGVTKMASIVIRLTTGAGTLVVETDDPSVKIAINGEEVSIQGAGVEELTLRPGEYTIAALKDGQPVKQELVKITRDGRTVVRMSLETIAASSSHNEVIVPVAGNDGWVSLMNGRDLSGWKTHPEQPGNWRVEDGIVVAEGPPISHLYTERSDFTNFHVYMEVKVSDGGDSGLHFRSPYGPSHEFSGRRYPAGYEAQIRTDDSGSLVAFLDERHQHSSAPMPAPESWIALEVIAIENHLVIRINGHVSLDFHDKNYRYRQGHLALQCAGDIGETRLQVRKLLIKELPAPAK